MGIFLCWWGRHWGRFDRNQRRNSKTRILFLNPTQPHIPIFIPHSLQHQKSISKYHLEGGRKQTPIRYDECQRESTHMVSEYEDLDRVTENRSKRTSQSMAFLQVFCAAGMPPIFPPPHPLSLHLLQHYLCPKLTIMHTCLLSSHWKTPAKDYRKEEIKIKLFIPASLI